MALTELRPEASAHLSIRPTRGTGGTGAGLDRFSPHIPDPHPWFWHGPETRFLK